MYFRTLIFTLFILFLSCDVSSDKDREEKVPVVLSLSGDTLFIPEETHGVQARKDSLYRIAETDYGEDPEDLNNIIWYGRRTAYLWRYQEAIDIFSKGIDRHPDAPELYRHRGHRYLSIRQFDKAIEDFKKAEELARDRTLEIEPDGIPNKLNQPLSNLHFNIYYHWALAHYFQAEFNRAAELFGEAMKWSGNPDLKVATADWLYMTYRRMGEEEKARQLLDSIPSDWDMVENESYYKRIRMYKEEIDPADLLNLQDTTLDDQLDLVTQGYGVGNWHLYNGNEEEAMDIFSEILTTDYWSAFGYIAAEAEISREIESNL